MISKQNQHSWIIFPVKLSLLHKGCLEVDLNLIWTLKLVTKVKFWLLWHTKKFPLAAADKLEEVVEMDY